MATVIALAAPSAPPLLAVSRDGEYLACACSKIVYLLRHDELVASYQLPARALHIAWQSGPHKEWLLSVSADGAAWRLQARDMSSSRKRLRELSRRRPQRADDEMRLPLGPLGRLDAACSVPNGILVWRADDEAGAHFVSLVDHSVAACGGMDSLVPGPSVVLQVRRGPPVGTSASEIMQAAPAVAGSGAASLEPSLFTALYGNGGGNGPEAALLIADTDEAGAIHCATMAELLSCGGSVGSALGSPLHAAAAAAKPLAALGEPAVALLSVDADTLITLGRRGAVLQLSAGPNGELRRELWRLPGATLLGAVAVNRAVVLLASEGAYVYHLEPRIPSVIGVTGVDGTSGATAAATAAAQAARMDAARAGVGGRWGWGLPSVLGSSVTPNAAPELSVSPLALAPCGVAGVWQSPDAASTATDRTQLVVMDVTGALRRVHVPAAAGAAAGSNAGTDHGDGSASCAKGSWEAKVHEERECFNSGYTERCLRERLRRVGGSAAALAEYQHALALADSQLQERVAAFDALSAMAQAGDAVCRIHLSEDAQHLVVDLQNPAGRPLDQGWTLSTTWHQELPVSQSGVGAAAAVTDDPQVSFESISASLAGLPAHGRWSVPVPVPEHAWHRALALQIFVTYRAPVTSRGHARDGAGSDLRCGDVASSHTMPHSACALIYAEDLHLHRMLRRRARWPRTAVSSDVALLARLRTILTCEVATGERDHGKLSSSGREVGGGVPEGGAHCKLRLRLDGGVGRGSPRALSATEWLQVLLKGAACKPTDIPSRSGSEGTMHQRQAHAALELPGGVGASLRLTMEAAKTSEAAATGTVNAYASLLLLIQADDAAWLWALRAGLVAQLVGRARPQTRLAVMPSTALSSSQCDEADAGKGPGGDYGGETGPNCDDLAKEVASLLPLYRRWQLAHVQLHEKMHRCFELRRLFDGGAASVSLRELSLEVAHECRRALDAHQALRGQVGCLALLA